MNKTLIIAMLILFSSTVALAGSSATVNDVTAEVDVTYTDASAQKLKMENDYTQTFEGSESLRGFTNSAGIVYPIIPSFFGPDTPGHSYQGMELILPLKSEWERWEVEEGITDTGIMFRCRYLIKTRTTLLKELSGKKKDEFYGPLKKSLEEKPEDSIIFIAAPPVTPFRMIGHITIWATDIVTTSFELMEMSALLGMDLIPATHLLITGQGCTKELHTSGWGVGGHHTAATISNSQKSSNVSAGGTGYSGGKAGNVEFPWLQLVILADKEE